MNKEKVDVSFTMSNDRTVVNITFAADFEISNRMLVEMLQDHVRTLNNVELLQ